MWCRGKDKAWDGSPSFLLPGNVICMDHVAPQRDLTLEQCGGVFRRLLIGWKFLHAGFGKDLLHFLIGKRGAPRCVDLVDDRPWRAGWHQQHVPEIDVELFVAKFAEGL